MHNPFVTWRMNNKFNDSRPDGDKFFALVFSSFLEARLKERGITSENSQQAEQILDEILEPFGLRLSTPFVFPGLPMMERAFSRIDDINRLKSPGKFKVKVSKDNYIARSTPAPCMTLDYSKYYGMASRYNWYYLHHYLMIRLRRLPNNTLDKDEVEEHSMEQQSQSLYRQQLCLALNGLWVHYNHDSLTSFELGFSSAQEYLPLSRSMAKLQDLFIDRESSLIPDHLLAHIVTFIKQNQEAFPRKPPLDVHFRRGWGVFDDNKTSSINSHNELDVDIQLVLARCRERRKRYLPLSMTALAILEAVGHPKVIQAHYIVNFYNYSQEIKLDRLQELGDTDQCRMDEGEGLAMRLFLRQCKRLAKLKLGVGNPDLFSWCAMENLETIRASGLRSGTLTKQENEAIRYSPIQLPEGFCPVSIHSSGSEQDGSQDTISNSECILPCLEQLELWSDRPHRFGLCALNDAMVAFAPSLKHVSLRVARDNYSDTPWIPNSLRKAKAIISHHLNSIPWANQIGEWPLLLPRLQFIEIDLCYVACIDVGSFNNCPNLEELKVQFGGVNLEDGRSDVNDGSENNRNPLNPYIQQPVIDKTLFPIWNLPKLKRLALFDLAALRFDFASLSNMPRLESLTLCVRAFASTLQSFVPYKSYQQKIWDERLASGSNGEDKANPTWSGTWTLPELKYLYMEGPPVSMFHLDWLLVCPKLESISLCSDSLQSIDSTVFFVAPKVSSSASSPPSSSLSPPSPSPKANILNTKSEDILKPFQASRLSRVELIGSWEVTERNFIRLLTEYAPFLREIRVNQLQGLGGHGYHFLRAINYADDIYEAYLTHPSRSCIKKKKEEVEQEQRQEGVANYVVDDKHNETTNEAPRRRLVSVRADYATEKFEIERLGLLLIESEEQYQYRSRGLRVYSLLNQVFVRRKDWEIVNK
ncbi:hypothetical protein BGZ76_004689 [Entomortierella beljakovae]|nr:hypothetical protein BGZ76_004689 [Entomortierella beljakovae]